VATDLRPATASAGESAERVDEAEETGIAAIEAGAATDAAALAVEVADERAAQRAALDAIGGGPAIDQAIDPIPDGGPGVPVDRAVTGFALRGISFEAAPGELVA